MPFGSGRKIYFLFLFATSSVSKSSQVDNIFNISISLYGTQNAWKCYVGAVFISCLVVSLKPPYQFLFGQAAKFARQ